MSASVARVWGGGASTREALKKVTPFQETYRVQEEGQAVVLCQFSLNLTSVS